MGGGRGGRGGKGKFGLSEGFQFISELVALQQLMLLFLLLLLLDYGSSTCGDGGGFRVCFGGVVGERGNLASWIGWKEILVLHGGKSQRRC